MPDNAVFYHVADAIALFIYSAYAASLYLRRGKIRRK